MSDPFSDPAPIWQPRPPTPRWQFGDVEIDEFDVHLAARGRGVMPDHRAFRSAEVRAALRRGVDDPYVEEDAECPKCDRYRPGVWMLMVRRNGTRIASLRCLVCTNQIAVRGMAGFDRRLPILEDNTATDPCARCGSTEGVEQHHWAPKHLFDDSWQWPTSDLCRACHLKWHSVVTPDMHRRAAS